MPVVAVVVLGRMHVALAAAAHGIDDKRRGVEAGGRTAHVLFQIERRLQRRAQVFHPRHHVVHVNVVGMHVDVAEPSHEQLHRSGVSFTGALQHSLAADENAALGQAIQRIVGDAGDFVGMIEVRVHHHVLVQRRPSSTTRVSASTQA